MTSPYVLNEYRRLYPHGKPDLKVVPSLHAPRIGEASFARQQSPRMAAAMWEREERIGKRWSGFFGGVILFLLAVWVFV